MKKTVFCIALAAVASLSGAQYSTVRVLAEDRYEDGRERCGAPSVVVGNVAPGLLVETGMGVYRTDGSAEIKLAEDEFLPPQGGRVRLMHSMRIYGMGGAPAKLVTSFKGVNRTFSVAIHSAGEGSSGLSCVISGDGMKDIPFVVPAKSLPADCELSIGDDGKFTFAAKGLADSGIVEKTGSTLLFKGLWKDGYGYRPLKIENVFSSCKAGESASLTIDEHRVSLVAPSKKLDVPCIVKPDAVFDPVKARWPLVFADEFEGDSVDWSKWYHRGRNCSGGDGRHTRVDGKGVLEIEAAYGKDGTRLESASLRSKREFVYGYYEAKVKLTRQNGWWAAFWMYGRFNTDPFFDGLEIDIFEDYYTRKIKPDGKNRVQLDHNLHMYLGTQLKSWNYNSDLDCDIDDWIVIGCKRTPFEISYYVNGKLVESSANHSAWSSVTYDAVNHATATVPLHLIVSGQIMGKSWPWFDKSKSAFPETFKVDYVRAYEMPREASRLPGIEWVGTAASDDGELKFFTRGEKLRFEVKVEKAKSSPAEIAAVYLYDAGYLVGCKTEAPYVFDVEMTAEWFSNTRYMNTGRQKSVPDFSKAPHSFVAFVQDASGRVAHTKKAVRRIPRFFDPRTSPYQGVAAKIPGRIVPWRYDEGGQGVAYFDTSKGNAYKNSKQAKRVEEDVDCTAGELASFMPGEWLNYTVDVEKTAAYDIEMRYGTAMQGRHHVHMAVDGEMAGVFRFEYAGDADSWAIDKKCRLPSVRLEKGRHVISFYTLSQLNIGGFSFAEAESSGELPEKWHVGMTNEWKRLDISVKSTLDGSMQPASFYFPPKARKAGAKVPLLVALHSWSYGYENKNPGSWAATECAKRGWAMLYPHFRGPNKTPQGCGSDLAVQDIVDQIDWVKENYPIDHDRVYILGGSGGGHMTLLMAGRHPEIFAAAYAACPISDIARWYRESSTKLYEGYAKMIFASCGGTPEEKKEEYAKRSPVTWLKRAKSAALPVSIITGIHDGHRRKGGGSVPVGHSIRAYNELVEENERLSEAVIEEMENTEKIPQSLSFKGRAPYFNAKNAVLMRLTSANARLTLFDAGHAGNYAEAAAWFSLQRRGQPARWDVSEQSAAGDGKADSVTK